MGDIWLPGYKRVDLGWAGAPYDEMAHPKLLWHTTEGTSVNGARAAFRNYPPHGCYDPWVDGAEQYVPLNRHAFALAGAESDDEFVIQWEIVGRAAESHTWPEWVLERLGRRVAAPIAAAVGVPAQHLRFYRADEGIVLARSTSPIRLSASTLRAFSGHLGHQHAPAPDAHWDPGGLPIDRILAYAHTQEDDMPLTDDDINRIWERTLVADGSNYPARARQWLIGTSGRAENLQGTAARLEGLLVQVLANQKDDLDTPTVLAQLDASVKAATTEALSSTILPAIQRIEAALAADDSVEAAAIVTELSNRLRSVA
jgi:hypothetical protein